MGPQVMLSILALSALVVNITSESNNCTSIKTHELIRVKRAKYYSYPQKFYRLPPMSYPIKGIFSYTPPPNYMREDEGPPYRPSKVSRPEGLTATPGLGDEDINNIVKYLSKKDLEKLMELVFEKDKVADYRNQEMYGRDERGRPESVYKAHMHYDGEFNGSYRSKYGKDSMQPSRNVANEETSNPFFNRQSSDVGRYAQENHVADSTNFARPEGYTQIYNNQEDNSHHQLNIKDVPMSFYKTSSKNQDPSKKQKENLSNPVSPELDVDIREYFNLVQSFNNEMTKKQEQLPRPENLRDEYETADSTKVSAVIKSENYEVKDFSELPLMNYHNSKLHDVSSYYVPHYTVTATKHQKPTYGAPSPKVPPIEAAPPSATGREQSDAHLKAVKIWTHRSQGAAYTLHDDGSLTPEKPAPKYGP